MMANAVKNLLIAMDMKSAEEKRFRDEFLSNTHKRGTISRDQLSFIASELKISRTDRCLKSTQITELKSELVGLKNDLELFKTVLQSVLGGGSLSSQRGHALDNIEKEVRATEHVKGYSRRAAASNGLGLEKNDHLDSLDTSSKLSGITSQSFRGESRVRHYENEIIAASEEPPSHSDMPAEIQLYKTNSYRNGSATKLPMRKTSNASSCDSSMILQEKRKHSSDDSLEGLPKKSRNDSCSDDNLAELQQMKKPRTGEHPLLKPTIVSLVLQFVGKGQYLFVCGVHKVWKSVYEAEYDSSKHQTHTIVPLASISALNYAFDCGLDVKNARFKSNATGFPLSLSWWSGHIAPYSTIKRFHELRKGDPMNICGGAASAGRLEVLRCLIEKQKWNCDNGSICINAAEVRGIYCISSPPSTRLAFSQPLPPCLVPSQAPKPNVLQWLFLNGIGKWDVVSMASMLRSAALFNRHMNAHFLSLVPKFQSRLKERKHRTMSDLENKSKRQLAIGQPATAKSFSMLDASATNGGSAAKRHRSASPEVALSVRLPNLEKKDGSSMSKGNSDDASQKVLYTTCVFFTKTLFSLISNCDFHPPNSAPLHFHCMTEAGHVGDCYGSNWLH